MNLRFKEGQKGKAGFILETDYRTCLPYCVKGSTSWVIGCTVTTETPEDSIIEESEEDIEIDLISENGFSREVTFYGSNILWKELISICS